MGLVTQTEYPIVGPSWDALAQLATDLFGSDGFATQISANRRSLMQQLKGRTDCYEAALRYVATWPNKVHHPYQAVLKYALVYVENGGPPTQAKDNRKTGGQEKPQEPRRYFQATKDWDRFVGDSAETRAMFDRILGRSPRPCDTAPTPPPVSHERLEALKRENDWLVDDDTTTAIEATATPSVNPMSAQERLESIVYWRNVFGDADTDADADATPEFEAPAPSSSQVQPNRNRRRSDAFPRPEATKLASEFDRFMERYGIRTAATGVAQ